jgi:rubrerythrin
MIVDDRSAGTLGFGGPYDKRAKPLRQRRYVMEKRMNALEVALNNEMKEHQFYKTNAERTSNPIGRAMFEQIAKEELEHHERLQQLHDAWDKQNKWPETVPLKVSNTAIRSAFKGALKKAPKAGKGDADDLKAIRTAIDFEAKGAAHYAQLRDASTNPQEKAFFDLLANIEHEHFVSLKDTEEFLTEPAMWYQKFDKTGLDGA